MTTPTTLTNIQERLFDRLVPEGDCLVRRECPRIRMAKART